MALNILGGVIRVNRRTLEHFPARPIAASKAVGIRYRNNETLKGRRLSFKVKGKTHKVKVSGRRTKIFIGGKKSKRKNLKVGMKCAVSYQGDGSTAKSVKCS